MTLPDNYGIETVALSSDKDDVEDDNVPSLVMRRLSGIE